jgi:hypothetical protein
MQCGWRLNRFSFDLLKSQSSGTMLTRTVVTHYRDRPRIVHWENRQPGWPAIHSESKPARSGVDTPLRAWIQGFSCSRREIGL